MLTAKRRTFAVERVSRLVSALGRSLAALLAGLALCSCATNARLADDSPTTDQPELLTNAPIQGFADPDNLRRLDALWKARVGSKSAGDYPIDSGDVLDVSVPAIPELAQRSERVSGDGSMSLPMIGLVQVRGLTEEQLREELAHKLDKYMYHPQVDVFVKEYRSRQAAVVGAVKSPGLVTLASPSETLLDVLTRSGGMAGNAADQVILIPAEQGGARATERLSSMAALSPAADRGNPDGSTDGDHRAQLQQASANEAMSLIPSSAQSVVIALHSTSLSGAGQYLGLPIRPGDVIVVPGGGDVMVVGWVQNPGHFSIGSGLTVLGAVGAAGGPMFAASLGGVRLIRTDKSVGKRVIPVNLAEITEGEEADLPVQGNDVIDVPFSWVKIGPYIFYQIVTRIGYGVGLPAPF